MNAPCLWLVRQQSFARCSGTFSPGLGGCLGLLQGEEEAVQQVQEALQHPAVAQ